MKNSFKTSKKVIRMCWPTIGLIIIGSNVFLDYSDKSMHCQIIDNNEFKNYSSWH